MAEDKKTKKTLVKEGKMYVLTVDINGDGKNISIQKFDEEELKKAKEKADDDRKAAEVVIKEGRRKLKDHPAGEMDDELKKWLELNRRAQGMQDKVKTENDVQYWENMLETSDETEKLIKRVAPHLYRNK